MPANVRLFAYEIDTHNSATLNQVLVARGLNPTTMSQKDLFEAQAAVQRDLIQAQVIPHVRAGEIPVFLAPEFFFKRADGMPYDRAPFFNGVDHLKTLSATVPAVLWVVGTVWWSEPMSNKAMVHNSAIILQNGIVKHTWQKERLSGIDGLRDGPETWDRWEVEETRILEETQDPFFSASPLAGAGTATCGIEICLDHLTLEPTPQRPQRNYGVLRTKYLAAHPNPDQGPGVDVHILTAAGMQLQNPNICAKSGGVIFRCDGGAGANPRSQSVRITRAGANPAVALRQWTPTLNNMNATYVGNDANNRLARYDAVAIA